MKRQICFDNKNLNKKEILKGNGLGRLKRGNYMMLSIKH
jgi:hypothetical protein